MDDVRSEVVAAVREMLPEFAERNGIELSPKTMDNLAHWVAGVVPSDCFRVACPASRINMACACPGTCTRWIRVGAALADELAAAAETAAPSPLGGTWSGAGDSTDFAIYDSDQTLREET